MPGTGFAGTRQVAAIGVPTVFNVKDYGAKGDGVTNDRPAIQSAMDACQYGSTLGGIVYFPAGTYLLNSVGPLLPNASNTNNLVTIRGAGRGATRIKLTANAKAAFQANYAWGHYLFEDFTVDANFQSGGTLGVFIDSNVLNGSVDDITARRVDVINALTPSFSADRRCINFTLITPSFGSTQYTATNLLFEDCYFGRSGGGGNYGIVVQGYPQALVGGANTKGSLLFGQGKSLANVWLDNITYNRCTYDSGQTVAQFSTFSSCGFMCGGWASGNKIRVKDCKVIRPVDDGYEIDNMLDVVMDGCYSLDSPNESFYFANLGGLANPERQVIKVVNCTDERTAENTGNPSNTLQLNSVAGVPLGHVLVENFTCISRDAQCYGPTFQGNCKSLTIRGLRYVSSGWTKTANANNFARTTVGLRLQLAEGRPTVVLEDIVFDLDGTFDASTFTGTSFVFTPIELDVLNDADLHVSGVQMKLKINAPNGGSIRATGITWNSGSMGTIVENFTTGADLTNDFVIDAGVSTDVTATGGVVTSLANPGTEQRRVWVHNSGQYYKGHVGPSTDQGFSVSSTPGSTLTGHKLGVLLKRTAANQYLECYVSDDGTNSTLNIDKIVAGARTNLATSGALGTRISNGALFSVRGVVQGETIIADYYTGAPGALSGSGAATVTFTLTNATDLANFGERGPQGMGGFSWIPADAAATLDNVQKYSLSLVRGRIEDVTLARLQGFTQFVGELINAASTTVRFKGLKEHGYNWRRGRTATLTEFSGGDATQLQEINRKDIVYATPPAPATASGASPFTYANQLGYEADVFVTAGTITGITITRNGSVASASVGTVGGVRLCPGDSATFTASAGTPAITIVPVL